MTDHTNTMNHTNGPWRSGGNCCGFSIKGADGKSVCAIASTVQRNRDESAANASLIIAAPLLLAACEEAVQRIGTGDGPGYKHRRAAVAQLTAAIAAARNGAVRR